MKMPGNVRLSFSPDAHYLAIFNGQSCSVVELNSKSTVWTFERGRDETFNVAISNNNVAIMHVVNAVPRQHIFSYFHGVFAYFG